MCPCSPLQNSVLRFSVREVSARSQASVLAPSKDAFALHFRRAGVPHMSRKADSRVLAGRWRATGQRLRVSSSHAGAARRIKTLADGFDFRYPVSPCAGLSGCCHCSQCYHSLRCGDYLFLFSDNDSGRISRLAAQAERAGNCCGYCGQSLCSAAHGLPMDVGNAPAWASGPCPRRASRWPVP